MGLSREFKQIWWATLVMACGVLLYFRSNGLVAGKPTYFDVVAFIVWIGICLAPLFGEIKIFGVELKQEIEHLKKDLSNQIDLAKMDLKASIAVSSNSSSQVFVGGNPLPPSDSELPTLKLSIQEALKELGFPSHRPNLLKVELSDETIELLKVRISLERAINRLARIEGADRRRQTISRTLREVAGAGLIRSEVANGAMEVIAICNYAVHGEDVTPAQVAFVRDSAPGLLAAIENACAIQSVVNGPVSVVPMSF